MIYNESAIDIRAIIKEMAAAEAQSIHSADHWHDDLQEYMKNGDVCTGDKLPWTNTHGLFQLKMGEVSIWCGNNGSYKSLILNQIGLHLAATSPVNFASLEMQPVVNLARMCRTAAGNNDPAPEYISKFTEYAKKRIYVYDQDSIVDSNRIIAMLYFAAHTLGCKHLILDSLMMVGLKLDGDGAFTEQTTFMNRLVFLAKHLNIHIHLVAHFRKKSSDRAGKHTIGSRYDILGASQISNLAANVIICHKNEAREAARSKMRAGVPLNEDDDQEMSEGHDLTLVIDKQRNDPFNGKFRLWLDEDSLQFTETKGRRQGYLNL